MENIEATSDSGSSDDSVFDSCGSDTSQSEPPSDTEVEQTTWKPKPLPRTQRQDNRDNTRKMEDALAGLVHPPLAPYKKRPYPTPPSEDTVGRIIDIAAISAIGMHYNLRPQSNEAFTTSLYEIDRLINDRQAELAEIEEDGEDWEAAVKKVLPKEY